MRHLLIPLRDPELRRRLLAAAQAEERSPAQQVLFILRRALAPAEDEPSGSPGTPRAERETDTKRRRRSNGHPVSDVLRSGSARKWQAPSPEKEAPEEP